jgi:hypothetical protein
MEFGDYWLVRPSEIKKLSKLKKAKSRAIIAKIGKMISAKKKERWVPIPLADDQMEKLFDVVLHFNNYEWSAWDFDVYSKGKKVLSVCFGENDECGISEDMNGIDGSVEKAAAALDVNPKKLKTVLEAEDMEKLAKLVGFDVLPITPTDLERDDDEGGYDE